MSQENRKQYFIDRSFQRAFITKFCLVTIASSILIGAIVYGFSRSSTTVAIENTKVTVKSTADFILPLLTLTVLLVILFSAIVVLVMTLYMSHRIAGAAYHLQKHVEGLTSGQLDTSCQIRKTDQLKGLAESLKTLTVTLSQKIGLIQERHRQLKDFLITQARLTPDDIKRSHDLVNEINELLSFFQHK